MRTDVKKKEINISIVIPNYNGEYYITECLESLTNMNYRDYELIIIDNASTDRSIELIKDREEEILLIVNAENVGFAKAVNQGIKLAKGEFVVLLNNDIEVDVDWLGHLYDSIKEKPNYFAISSKMLRYTQRDRIDDAGDGYTVLGWAYKHGDGRPSSEYLVDREVFSACAGAAIYRKRVFEEIGYFDEVFFAYLEDVDLSFRARLHGYDMGYSAHSIVYHIGSATSGSKYNDFKVKLAARNNFLLVYKNMPLVLWVINLPALIVGDLVKWLVMSGKGYGKAYYEGKIDGYKNIKNMNRLSRIPLNRSLHIQWLLIKDTFNFVYDFLKKLIT